MTSIDITQRINNILYSSKTDKNNRSYFCRKCGWVYDPTNEGKQFSEQPDIFKCPSCDSLKSQFQVVEKFKKF